MPNQVRELKTSTEGNREDIKVSNNQVIISKQVRELKTSTKGDKKDIKDKIFYFTSISFDIHL